MLITVLTSGGLDSTACLRYYLSADYRVDALWVDYGQAAARAEERAAEKITAYYRVALTKIRVGGIAWPELKGELFEFRARNLTLVSLALNAAHGEGGLIALGIHGGTSFIDCSSPFVDQLDNLVGFLAGGRFRLDCPFLHWNKADITHYAVEQGVPIDLTYSCERGQIPPCQECVKCRDNAMYLPALPTKSVNAGDGLSN